MHNQFIEAINKSCQKNYLQSLVGKLDYAVAGFQEIDGKIKRQER